MIRCPLPLLALACLLAAPLLQAAETPLSFDHLNQLAQQRHPGALVVEAGIATQDDRRVYEVELHDQQGARHELVLDAGTGSLIEDRGYGPGARLPLTLGAGESAPSWDALNAVALAGYPGGTVMEASLRRIGDGRLLYEVELDDAAGEEHELVIEVGTGRVLGSRSD